jgi:hypothetical protein
MIGLKEVAEPAIRPEASFPQTIVFNEVKTILTGVHNPY